MFIALFRRPYNLPGSMLAGLAASTSGGPDGSISDPEEVDADMQGWGRP
jgi:hypothetical protein